MKPKYAFISYSSLNYAATLKIKDVLERNGISCWMAPQSISAGGDYATEIPKAIEECGVFVLVLSRESQASQWVPKELDLAIDFERPVIPFHIDDQGLNPAFNFRLTNVQRIEAYGRLVSAYEELVGRIKTLWGDQPAIPHKPPVPHKDQPVPPKKGGNGKGYMLVAALMVVLALAAAFLFLRHQHTWEEATCTAAKTCTTCGATEGGPLGHSGQAATCTAPRTCKTCGATEGAPLGHNWRAATCTAAKTCLNCGITDGNAAEHDWAPATRGTPRTCRQCGATEEVTALDVAVGDTIVMGHYGGEAVEWIVLEFDPATNQALLISKYGLDAVAFHAGSDYGSWENSTLRKWLNNSFLSTAFTQEERDSILTVQITTPDNADYGTDSGGDTTDRVFLLSYEEAVYYFPSQTSRQCAPTAYCKAQGCYDPVEYAREHGTTYEPETVGYTWWWLRTAGKDENNTCNVMSKGAASTYGAEKTSNVGAVRPAMWVQLG